MFSMICAWVHNREVGDLRRHSVHYDVTVMMWCQWNPRQLLNHLQQASHTRVHVHLIRYNHGFVLLFPAFFNSFFLDSRVPFTHMFQGYFHSNVSINVCRRCSYRSTIRSIRKVVGGNRWVISSRWRHNGRDCVSNHQPYNCLLNRLFGRKSKKTSKLRVTGLCVGNSPRTGEFPAQMASNAENISIWWRHHVCIVITGNWNSILKGQKLLF